MKKSSGTCFFKPYLWILSKDFKFMLSFLYVFVLIQECLSFHSSCALLFSLYQQMEYLKHRLNPPASRTHKVWRVEVFWTRRGYVDCFDDFRNVHLFSQNQVSGTVIPENLSNKVWSLCSSECVCDMSDMFADATLADTRINSEDVIAMWSADKKRGVSLK